MSVGTDAIEPNPAAQAVKGGRTRKGWINWLFVAPAILFQFFWGWYPMVVAIFLSLTNAPIRGALTFRGIENYTRLAADPLVPMAFRVTLIYGVMSDHPDLYYPDLHRDFADGNAAPGRCA